MPQNSQRPLSPLYVILPGTIGFVLGAAVILFRAYDNAVSRQFVESPGFLAWLFLISFIPALAGIFFPPVMQSLMQLEIQPGKNWRELSIFLLPVITLISIPFVLPEIVNVSTVPVRPLTYHSTKILIIAAISYVVAVPSVVGIYMVHSRLSTLMASEDNPHDQIDRFIQLRSHLQTFLTALGSLIGASTLATGMLRNVILNLPGTSPDQFPPELVLAFGGYYTLFVAAVYVPVFMTLTSAGHQLCDTIFPLPAPDDKNWTDIYDKREKLETLLHIQNSSIGNFTESFIIAAPLIGSAISLLLQ